MAGTRRAPGRIFINYRREDAAGVAGRLADSLTRYFGAGRIFRDVDSIAGGEDFIDVLHQTAGSADAMIVLIGPRWRTVADASGQPRLDDPQDWVSREIALAIERKIPVYPVLVEQAVMPREAELPEALRPLARYNAQALSDQRWSSDVTRLAKVVAIDIPGSAAERTLRRVQAMVTLVLWLAIAIPLAIVAANGFSTSARATELISLAQSGLAFVAIVGVCTTLLVYVRLVDPAQRRWVYAAVVAGLAGTLAFFLLFGWLGRNDERVPLLMTVGSTLTAALVMALAGTSGFKAR